MAEFSITTTYTVNCPACGSERVVKVGKQSAHQRYQCGKCQKKFRDQEMVKGRKFESEQIGAAIRDYHSGMSYKQIAEAMEDRYDIPEPSKRTIYNWVSDFAGVATDAMRDYPAHTGSRWVADEMVVKVGGKNVYHWNVMDSKTRYVLATHLAKRRTHQEAAKTLQKALAAAAEPPKTITTDKYQAYPRAIKAVLPDTRHIQSEGIRAEINNNLSERLQGTYRDRIKTLRGMDSIETGQRYLDGWTTFYNLFREHYGLGYKTPGEVARVNAPFTEWADVVRSGLETPKRPKGTPKLPVVKGVKEKKRRRWKKKGRATPQAIMPRRAKPVVLPGQRPLPLFDKATPRAARPRIAKPEPA